ncbi:Btb/Poz Domain-Containing Protein 7 [Manis pentadactyla]|nr:Btb/Poz Domain-Containing Protein 7 [Manis pentadactyla]
MGGSLGQAHAAGEQQRKKQRGPCYSLLTGTGCRKGMSATWCSPEDRGMDQGPCREVGGNFAGSGHASPIRAPCLSEAGLKGPPSTPAAPSTP